MELITSRNNPKVKQARALRQRKARREQGVFLVEGLRHLGEAVEARAAIQSILYAPELLQSDYGYELIESQSQAGVPCYATTPDVFNSMAEKDNPQGILAVVRQPDRSLDQLNTHNFIWGVGLIAAQDPGNLGTILRTIDAVGASGLIIMDTSVDPYHPSAVRASMGTIFWYPPVITSFKAFILWSRTHGYQLYGTSAHAESDYRTAAYRLPGILLLGSERQGLTTEQAEVCDQLVSIPMRGRGTSLNVSIAAGVMLYAMLESMTNHS